MNDRQSVEVAIAEAVRNSPAATPGEIVKFSLTPELVRQAATLFVSDYVDHVFRAAARRVEAAATSPVLRLPSPPLVHQQPYAGNKAGRAAIMACGCEECLTTFAKWEAQQDEVSSDAWSKISRVVSDFREKLAVEIRLELTDELLGTEFALGDGARVTWGRATLDQHQQRIDLLHKNAVANVETAAKHQWAVNALSETGSSNLGELKQAA